MPVIFDIMGSAALFAIVLALISFPWTTFASISLTGSVDKPEAHWGQMQKFQYKLTLPKIPESEKIDLALSFISQNRSVDPLHIYKVNVSAPATATIGATYGPFFTELDHNSYIRYTIYIYIYIYVYVLNATKPLT